MPLTATTAGLTDQGRVRKNNEDAVWVDPESGLLIVADGMGGHQSGEVASGLAIQTIPENFKRLGRAGAPETLDEGVSAATNRLAYCVKMANRVIFEASKKYPKDKGMGCTCTCALIENGRVGLAHVGDSRAYLVRRGELQQLTHDHSLVMDQVRQGLITKEEAEKSNLQNVLTRALGTQPDVEIDVDEHPLLPGDLLLLCSDGLFKDVPEDEIRRIAAEVQDPQELTRRLIERANEGGGRDNVTVAVARIRKASFWEMLKRLLERLFP